MTYFYSLDSFHKVLITHYVEPNNGKYENDWFGQSFHLHGGCFERGVPQF